MKKTAIVTGGAGFLGKFVVKKLSEHYTIFVPRSQNFDIRKKQEVEKIFDVIRPDVVVHLAAKVGGIGANKKNPGKFFYDNIMMGLNLVETSREYGIDKFIHVGTVCSYPKYCSIPFREEDLWNGYPEETNAPYGISKKAIITMLGAYREQYGLKSAVLLPVNLYGPGDNFDEDTSHVIPSLIKKIYNAKVNGDISVKCWGDGSASREFLYVEDAAEAICRAVKSDIVDPYPINLAGCGEITIKRLAQIIKEHIGYSGNIEWDSNMPNGQPRRCLDGSRAKELLGWQSETDFIDGIRNTIRWYIQMHN
jgi:GDP-L-fucose synthase